jgi:hypothetical protein
MNQESGQGTKKRPNRNEAKQFKTRDDFGPVETRQREPGCIR